MKISEMRLFAVIIVGADRRAAPTRAKNSTLKHPQINTQNSQLKTPLRGCASAMRTYYRMLWMLLKFASISNKASLHRKQALFESQTSLF
jgi:hypothetical protein